MVFLLLGGSGSGKSERAEEVAAGLSAGGTVYYLATMRREGEEAEKRIQRHRALRKGKGFITAEYPVLVDRFAQETELSEATVLLECLSNLVANELFPGKDSGLADPFQQAEGPEDFLCRQIEEELIILSKACRHLVLVSNDIFGEGLFREDPTDDPYLKSYILVLGRLNSFIASLADEVVEVVAGIPVVRKGEPWPFSVLS